MPSVRESRYFDLLPSDQRTSGQRDRDRILYCSAFHRLAGITQVTSPAERRVCHNRLTHSLKVGQIARRIAERLASSYRPGQLRYIGGISADIVEAASLAHDIGHPPFGHAGELALQDSITKATNQLGSFEGNAQSFRVVTKLSSRSDLFPGLDLTRATMNALLKYPWTYSNAGGRTKWGAYEEERDEYTWARAGLPPTARGVRTVEAEIMDTADDIAYAVHDMEDFFRAGIVPLDRLVRLLGRSQSLTEEGDHFTDAVFSKFQSDLPGSVSDLRTVFAQLVGLSGVTSPYRGYRQERATLRAFTSMLIGRYIDSTTLQCGSPAGERLGMPQAYRQEIFMLQKLTWYYMIRNPMLCAQQEGQRRLLRKLFDFFFESAMERDTLRLPPRARDMLKPLVDGVITNTAVEPFCARLAGDVICAMTEPEAENVARRILGISSGTAFDRFQ